MVKILRHNHNTRHSNIARVVFAAEWRENLLCFTFQGASKRLLSKIFNEIESLYGDYCITFENQKIINGKCHKTAEVTISTSATKISEKELISIITYMLKKQHYSVTHFNDVTTLLNL